MAEHVVIHESFADYLALASGARDWHGRQSQSYDHNWDLGISGKQALRLGATGDPSVVAGMTHALDKLRNSNIVSDVRSRNVASVAGTRVNVPLYLGGSPKCMIRRGRREVEARHIKIVVCGCCSSLIRSTDMLKRGQAILALLETLQSVGVSTDLYLSCDLNVCGKFWGHMVRIETRPLDLSVSGFALAHPAFARNVMYNVINDQAGLDATAAGPPASGKLAIAEYGLAPTDVYVPGPLYGDDLIVTNPEKWIEERLIQVAGNNPAV